jgi:hypothetical protein
MPPLSRALLALTACAIACGGGHPTAKPTPVPAALAFPAAQWIPAKPTYVLASRKIRDAQRSIHDVVDSFGMLLDVRSSHVTRWFQDLLSVDALNPDALTAIGIDVDSGIAMFSEDLNPTLVVRIAAPDLIAAFFDGLRSRGLVTQSVIVDGTEVYSAQAGPGFHISWAIAKDWLWLHFALPIAHDDGTTWFTAGHPAARPTWGDAWTWAARGAEHANLTGFAELHPLIASLASRAPQILACARLFEPVSRVSLRVDGDGRHAGGRLGFEVGAAAASVGKAILPPPAGWATVAKQAPLAAQWNLDLVALNAWIAPCLRAARIDELDSFLDKVGVRSARAVVQSLDLDAMTGTGVVSLDLVKPTFLAKYLDKIPMRSALEKDRSFGPYAGHSVAIPFVGTIDFVLTDKVAFAGTGDGLLASAIGSGPGTGGPVFALDVSPPGLSAETWTTLFSQLPTGRPAKSMIERFLQWQDGHVAMVVDGDQLVFEAAGNRR